MFAFAKVVLMSRYSEFSPKLLLTDHRNRLGAGVIEIGKRLQAWNKPAGMGVGSKDP